MKLKCSFPNCSRTATERIQLEDVTLNLCEYHAELITCFLNSDLPEDEDKILSVAIFQLAQETAKNKDTRQSEKLVRRCIIYYIANKLWNELAEDVTRTISEVRKTYGEDVANSVYSDVVRIIYDAIADFIFISLSLAWKQSE